MALIQLVTPQGRDEAENQPNEDALDAHEGQFISGKPATELGHFVYSLWEEYRRARSQSGIDMRIIEAAYAFQGIYDIRTQAVIDALGGSDVYARVIASRVRTAHALLSEIYQTDGERPWSIDATPEPTPPVNIVEGVNLLLQSEIAAREQAGVPATEDEILIRQKELVEIVELQMQKNMKRQSEDLAERIEDWLVEGDFETALSEVIHDMCLFPYGVLKGPVIEYQTRVTWEDGEPVPVVQPVPVFRRVHPFDVWWAPGARSLKHSPVFERVYYTRASLAAFRNRDTWDTDAIERVLDENPNGFSYVPTGVGDTEELKHINNDVVGTGSEHGNAIQGLHYCGAVSGKLLKEMGFDAKDGVTDDNDEYPVRVYMAANEVIGVRLEPSLSKSPPYYSASYDAIPGSIAGNGLHDILADVSKASQTVLRSLCNNVSLGSGPQVAVEISRLPTNFDYETMAPWKVWPMTPSAVEGNRQPVVFFQPNMHAQELLAVYEGLMRMADDQSAIPRYMSGADRAGSGAGRTASGLAMMLNNASRTMSAVTTSIDKKIVGAVVQDVFLILAKNRMLGGYSGDAVIRARGTEIAAQNETLRARIMELLQITANPIDVGIIGMEGRAGLLREGLKSLGLPRNSIIPSEQQMKQNMQQQAERQAQEAQQGGAPGGQGSPPAAKGPPDDNVGAPSMRMNSVQ